MSLGGGGSGGGGGCGGCGLGTWEEGREARRERMGRCVLEEVSGGCRESAWNAARMKFQPQGTGLDGGGTKYWYFLLGAKAGGYWRSEVGCGEFLGADESEKRPPSIWGGIGKKSTRGRDAVNENALGEE